jgi:outer membrane biosynthesis protein TonB
MTEDQLGQFAREDRITSVDSPFSLHDVGERGVSVHWDEAVAIVEELCEVAIATSGDAAPVPALEDVLIDGDGRITLRRTKGDKNPSAAGRVLHTLLGNGDVPMPLRLFVTQSIVQGTHSSLREFARGLGYFGKSSRQRLIQDVYARCAQAGQRAANAPPVQSPPPLPKSESELAKKPAAPPASTRRRLMRLALAAAVLGLAISAAWIWRSGRSGQDVQGSAERVLSEAAAVLADLGKQVRDTISPTAAPAPSVAEPGANSGSTGRRRRASSASVADRLPEPAPLRSRRVSMPKSGGALQLAMTTPNAVASAPAAVYERPKDLAPESSPVYSSADSSVDPPVLSFPQLIPQVVGPGASSSILNRMVVIVSAEGTVERVQLVEGPARMPDMMMLSGVKTWRFTPAFKDGEPVRYRTVISWAALP